MNGQLFLLLISMMMQIPRGDVLPDSNRNGPPNGFPTGMPTPTPVLTTDSAGSQCAIGWGTDIHDGKFCMTIQIAPEAISAFAKGPQGQELPADVPDGIRSRIERVIVRIGSGPVERNLPNPQSFSDGRTTGNLPHIANLDSRSTVPIDAPRFPAVLPASGGAGLPNGNGLLNSGSIPNNGAYTPGGIGTNSAGLAGSTGFDNGYNSNSGTLPTGSRNEVLPLGATTSSTRDGFQPAQNRSQPFGFLQSNPTTSGASGYPTNVYPSTQGNNYATQGNNYATQGNNYATQGNYASGTNNNRPYTPLASNTNPATGAPSYNDGSIPQQPYYPNNSPSLAHSQQYGAPVTQQAYPYASTNAYPIASTSNFAGVPIPGLSGVNPTNTTNEVFDDQPLTKEKLLPSLLVFSIVVNVYLGMWMKYSRTRYRELLSDKRGIPLSDLG